MSNFKINTRASLLIFILAFFLACDNTKHNTQSDELGIMKQDMLSNMIDEAGTETSSQQDMMSPNSSGNDRTASLCPFIEDGVCDEPTQCALGTDEIDCTQKCQNENLPLGSGVCDYRTNIETGEVEIPSLVYEGPFGHISGTFTIISGDDPSQKVPRHYRAYIPHSINVHAPAPLLFMLPGHRVALDPLANYTQLIATADLEGFIVVFVEQEFRSDLRWAWWTDWDWSNQADAADHPDIQLLSTLIDHFTQNYPVDRERVYVSGHSRGAAMALIAAVERPNLFAGAIIQSGFTEFNYHRRLHLPTSDRVPALVFIHGVEDPDVCIDCKPNERCAVTNRSCGSTVYAADALVAQLQDLGWPEDHLIYYRLEGVAHRWQPQLNSIWWAWLKQHQDPSFPMLIWPKFWPTQSPRTIEEVNKIANAPLVDLTQMVNIAGGTLAMGVPLQDPQPYGDGWYIDWTPEFSTEVNPFYLDYTEVTVTDYARFLTHAGLATHYHPEMPILPVKDGYIAHESSVELPIHYVNWNDAYAYCVWAGKRLPKEKEFEWVATAKGTRSYPWEEGGPTCQRAAAGKDGSYCTDNPVLSKSYEDTTPVNTPLNLIGNVAEWIHDSYDSYPNASFGLSQHLPSSGLKVVRGGSFYHSGAWMKGEARWVATEQARGRSLGFRCAWDQSMEDFNASDQYIRGELIEASAMPTLERLAVLPAAPIEVQRPKAIQLYNGLITPVDFTPYQEGWAIIERDLGKVSWWSSESYDSLIEDLIAPIHIASHGEDLWIAEESGRVLYWSQNEIQQTYEEGEGTLEDLVADQFGVAWVRGNQLFWLDAVSDTMPQMNSLEIQAPIALALYEDEIFISSARRILSMNRSSGNITELLTGEILNTLNPSRVAIHPSDHTMSTIMSNPNWPYQGLICDLDATHPQGIRCTHYSPPRAKAPLWVEDTLVWQTHRSIATTQDFDNIRTYDLIGIWHRPTSLQMINNSKQVIWLDSLEGAIWTQDLNTL
jgi:formylglycine-generating enzyme